MVKYINTGRWTSEEHCRFVQARKKGVKWEEVAEIVGTRNADQCRSHNQKMKIQKINKGCSRGLILNFSMVDRGTQCEVPLRFYSDRQDFVSKSENGSQLTKASEVIDDRRDDFERSSLDCCDQFFFDN